MFKQLTAKLVIPDGADFGVNKSSLLHGVISEKLPTEYADKMHEQSLHPYSQYIYRKDDCYYWVINTLDNEADEHIIQPLMEADDIYIEHNDMLIRLGEKSISEISTDDLFVRYALNCSTRKTGIRFITPTAFKSSGQYVNIPSVPLVFGSLINKYDCFSGNSLYSEEFMREISERVIISSFNLKSAVFPLEGVTIPAFTGRITFYVRGGGALPGIINMLCEFARYSGVGIKTALGMGAADIQRRGEENG